MGRDALRRFLCVGDMQGAAVPDKIPRFKVRAGAAPFDDCRES